MNRHIKTAVENIRRLIFVDRWNRRKGKKWADPRELVRLRAFIALPTVETCDDWTPRLRWIKRSSLGKKMNEIRTFCYLCSEHLASLGRYIKQKINRFLCAHFLSHDKDLFHSVELKNESSTIPMRIRSLVFRTGLYHPNGLILYVVHCELAELRYTN